MTGNRPTLEQFIAADRTAMAMQQDRRADLLPDESGAEGFSGEPGIEASALMGAAPIRRASSPSEDPASAEAAARAEELAKTYARLTGLIQAIEADRAASVDAAVSDVAATVATVGAELLSSVIDEGVATEIAAAVSDLAARIPHRTAELNVAPDDHDPLAAAIAAQGPAAAITLVSNPSLTSGQARMNWPDGGADLDASRLVDRIAPAIAERLNGLTSRSIT